MSKKDLFMYRTDRIYVTENHELYAYLDDFAHKAKCLHNATLFRVRNAFTAHSKTALTANEKEVLLCAWVWHIAEAYAYYI